MHKTDKRIMLHVRPKWIKIDLDAWLLAQGLSWLYYKEKRGNLSACLATYAQKRVDKEGTSERAREIVNLAHKVLDDLYSERKETVSEDDVELPPRVLIYCSNCDQFHTNGYCSKCGEWHSNSFVYHEPEYDEEGNNLKRYEVCPKNRPGYYDNPIAIGFRDGKQHEEIAGHRWAKNCCEEGKKISDSMVPLPSGPSLDFPIDDGGTDEQPSQEESAVQEAPVGEQAEPVGYQVEPTAEAASAETEVVEIPFDVPEV